MWPWVVYQFFVLNLIASLWIIIVEFLYSLRICCLGFPGGLSLSMLPRQSFSSRADIDLPTLFPLSSLVLPCSNINRLYLLVVLAFSIDLSLGQFIEVVVEYAAMKIAFRCGARSYISPKAAPHVYGTFFGPYMAYCFHSWAGALARPLSLLSRIQLSIERGFEPFPAA